MRCKATLGRGASLWLQEHIVVHYTARLFIAQQDQFLLIAEHFRNILYIAIAY